MIAFNTEAYVRNLDQNVEKQFDFEKATTFGGTIEWQNQFRERLAEISGYNAVRAENRSTPLSPQFINSEEKENYVKEKWIITTEPGVEIPFYLLLPLTDGPFPLALTPHGHGFKGKEIYVGNYENEQERQEGVNGERDIALQAVAEGFAVIAMDVRGFWEMARFHDRKVDKKRSCDELQKRAYLFGRTIIGERCHDMGRLIEFAETDERIDTSRIMITGNSGGGAVSLFAAALDQRISVCVPSCFFCTFHDSIISVPHCLCNFIPGVLKLGELSDIAGLIAPRPVLFVNGINDRIFPIEATRKAYDKVRGIYRSLGAEEQCELYVGDGGHRYYKKPVWPFARKHIMQK